ncbi:metallo-beta-lactamase family protein [Marivirga sericea]|uniref:Metallo-beta-lactamase family protein n=1 Tax=Marivirga sericea TaxID=1028 RepID=A0A1X7KFW9_9BACT|nr:MBL fold metallo-hydrolase [Marivirga sericea]SMG40147.1 metallo-beta-lactamase family protein [Marivirga sericea]
MDVRVKFLGGAQSVTGSKFLLEVDNYRLLIDCGLFQGLKKLRLRNWEEFPIDVNEIDAIILTHAHLDHSGYVPRLVKQGYKKNVYCTEGTADLLEIMWMDSAKLQEEEAEFAKQKGYSKHKNPLALYGQKDAEASLKTIIPKSFEKSFDLTENIQVKFYPAGHILGAASVEIILQGDNQRKNIIFSGDLGRNSDPVLFPPTLFKHADVVFLESTYGDRLNDVAKVQDELKKHILEHMNDGVIMIPAFTVGRTQNLLFYVHELMKTGQIPHLPVYIDSPMAISVTHLYKKYTEQHRLEDKSIFEDKNFHYVREHQHSKALDELKDRAIIISASGMLTGGRILSHLFKRLGNENDLLLMVGFQAVGTRGRDILEGKESVKIYGEEVPIKCNFTKIDGLSAHADQTELLDWYATFVDALKLTFLVHGEPEAMDVLKTKLEEQGAKNVFIPDYMESFELFSGI